MELFLEYMQIYGYVLIFYWITVCFYTYLDLTTPSWYIKYKTQPYRNISYNRINQMIYNNVLNQFVITPLFMLLWCELLKLRGLDTSEPIFTTYVSHFIVYFMITEVLFYYFHRFLHIPYIYNNIHYIHHDEQNTIALSTFNNHPIEHILTGLISINTGHLLLGSNIKVFHLWSTLVIITSIVFHSGVHLPFLFPNEFHDYHHLVNNQCYGAFGIMDKFHKTDTKYRKSLHYKRDRVFFPGELYPQYKPV